MHYLCYDIATLSADISYTFGVTIVNKDVMPYVLAEDTFEVEQFQAALGTAILNGTSYNLMASMETGGLLLMRLIGSLPSSCSMHMHSIARLWCAVIVTILYTK